MRTLAYCAGAVVELFARAPWRDLGGAAVLFLTVASVYAFMWLVVPEGWR